MTASYPSRLAKWIKPKPRLRPVWRLYRTLEFLTGPNLVKYSFSSFFPIVQGKLPTKSRRCLALLIVWTFCQFSELFAVNLFKVRKLSHLLISTSHSELFPVEFEKKKKKISSRMELRTVIFTLKINIYNRFQTIIISCFIKIKSNNIHLKISTSCIR